MKKIIIFLFATPLFILLWMNFTPGHFQSPGCCEKYGYYTMQEVKEINKNPQCALKDCMLNPIYKIKIFYILGMIDLNK